MTRHVFSIALVAYGIGVGCHSQPQSSTSLLRPVAVLKTDLLVGRDLKPHLRGSSSLTLADLLKPEFSDPYNALDPYRSLLVSDCTSGATWCRQSQFGVCDLLGRVLGAAQTKIVANGWYLYMNDDPTFQLDAKNWGGSLCGAPLQLLAVVNRLDFAESADAASWEKAELRFVFAAKKDFTLIVEFVLPELTWTEFQNLAKEWARLSTLELNTAAFAPQLLKVVNAARTESAPKVRLRVNRLHTPQQWRLGEWDFTAGQTFQPNVKLQPSVLDQQLKATVDKDTFLDLAAKTPSDATSVDMPANLLSSGLKQYSPSKYAMPIPVGVSLDDPRNTNLRNMIALQQCTWCHTTESGTNFAHINVGKTPGSAALSPFLIGARKDKPAIENLFYANCGDGTIWCTELDYYPGGDQSQPVQHVTRRFHDLGRRLMFLSAVLAAPPNLHTGDKALELIQAFRSGFTH